MKKFEKAEITINNLNNVEYGWDYQLLKTHFEKKNLEFTSENIDKNKIEILYKIELYYFKEGRNSFTVTFEERI